MKEVPGSEGYFVTADGVVYSKWRRGWHYKEGPIYAPKLCALIKTNGYLSVSLGPAKREYVHTLVLLTFVGPRPTQNEACHENGVKTDNRLANLRWGTASSNQLDRGRHGTANKGARNGQAVLCQEQVDEIRRQYSNKEAISSLSVAYAVGWQTISDIVKNKTWKD